MCLLITVIAAIVATVIWYTHAQKDTYKVGVLAVIYWGASLMWFVDFIFEYAQLHSEYFNQDFSDILNDSILGIVVTVIGLIAWLIILLIKDPKDVFRKKFMK
ncbi:MAG: hypothetical protein ACI4IQ_02595 [Eubacterium sp.]